MYTAQGNHALTTSAPPPLAAMPGHPEKVCTEQTRITAVRVGAHRPAIDLCTETIS